MADVDVLIVGAGISGIGMACHLTRICPSKSYAVLEARDDLGGTWDLFTYPGIRSDSDMYTLGYEFKPWASDISIAPGPMIKSYVIETAVEHDVMRHITFGRRVVAAEWSSETTEWTVTADHVDADGQPTGEQTFITCHWLQMCSGYYSYTDPHRPDFPGEHDFEGRIEHPQFWPDDLHTRDQLEGKKIVVIGSGATAVTLIPALAEQGAHVTMLQRTPTWIAPAPSRNPITVGLRKLLPEKAAYRTIRALNAWRTEKIYSTSRTDPDKVKKLINREIDKALQDAVPRDPHFTPDYDPWDQRLCLSPDADIFAAIREGTADVVTDHIDHFTSTGILLEGGDHLDADIIVTATGLSLLALGGVSPVVDGETVNLEETFTFKGFMYSGVPNLGTVFGYINASWTLRADLIAKYVARLIEAIDEKNADAVTPIAPDGLTELPYITDFPAGYMKRGLGRMPKQSDTEPWVNCQTYSHDKASLMKSDTVADVADPALSFTQAGDSVGQAHSVAVTSGVS
ncbi:MAG: NAD(P)/FAD-dependent oxidoreductase [Actinomycetota bacterium]